MFDAEWYDSVKTQSSQMENSRKVWILMLVAGLKVVIEIFTQL